MEFYLGTHQVRWLERVKYPLFMSATRLRMYVRKWPTAACRWAMDSGGFTELNKHGRWSISPRQYIDEIKRATEECGSLVWAAAQDWMCEPFVLQKTGKTIEEHQRLTLENYLELQSMNPSATIIPVLQGWDKDDYLRHVDMYVANNIYLDEIGTVGIGTVCRRQHTTEAEQIIKTITAMNIRLHGFGFKIKGLVNCKDHLWSSDSMAWSFSARKRKPLSGCTHKTCANCIKFATLWRDRVCDMIGCDNEILSRNT